MDYKTRMIRNLLFLLFVVFLSFHIHKHYGIQREPTLIFAQLPITYSAVTHIAHERGYYSEYGLDYRPISVPAGPDIVSALKGRGTQTAIAGGIAVTPVVTMIGAGDDPVIIATTLVSDNRVKIVTFSKNKISDDPSTLRGKRIGVVRNTIGDIYLSKILMKGDLTQEDVIIINGRPADLKSLLVNGNIDCAILWDPYVMQSVRSYKEQVDRGSVQDRGEPMVLSDPSIHTLAFNVVTTREKLNENSEKLIMMVNATIKAGEFIEKEPEIAQDMLSSWLGLEREDLDDLMENSSFKVHLDVPKMKQWMDEEMAWLEESRPDLFVPEDFSQYIDASILKSINPDLVKE